MTHRPGRPKQRRQPRSSPRSIIPPALIPVDGTQVEAARSAPLSRLIGRRPPRPGAPPNDTPRV